MTDLASRAVDPRVTTHAPRAAFACMAVLAVVLGVGRFAFTPLLPLMLQNGTLDIRHGGWLASLNYAGYFLGAITCAALRFDAARVVKAGLVATVVLVLAMGVTNQFWIWAAVRFAAGVVSAWTFVFASQWGLRQLAERGANQWGGVIYAGPGIGIATTGLLVGAAGAHDASMGWLGFGIVSALLAACVWRTFATTPTAMGTPASHEAYATRATHATHATNAAPAVPAAPASGMRPSRFERSRVHRADAAWLIVLYGAPGFGYIITATFLPVIARAALPVGSVWPDLFWPMFGVALVVGALAAGRLPAHWDNRTLLAGCYVLQALGIGLGIIWPTAGGFAIGSMLIGLPFTAITMFAMREARRLHGDDAAGLMGYATAAYGLGQIVGPLVAALIAAHTGSFSLALWLAAGALLAGAIGLIAVANVRGR